mmetsp:Transcript_16774/g.23337  ORF Transcript_16774/g.23337 Transcript_16774/m.23337 type:complete len:221 (+) Transcript_16774:200-862(+)
MVVLKQKYFIDSHKGATPIFILFLIWYYNQWNNTVAWIYWAMHSSYGILWCTKSYYFPDANWEQPCSLGYVFAIYAFLNLYWISPWLIISRETPLILPPWYLGCVLMLYIFGIFLHFVSDMQKTCYLELEKPRRLITSKLWSRSRNPNYLGELMIYTAFALMSYHWVPLLIVGIALAGLWGPNMKKKDKSLSRYSTYEAYRAHSGLLIPYLGRIPEEKTK